MALYPEGARKVVQAKTKMNWDIRLVSSGPLTDEQYMKIDGGDAEGTLGFCHYPDPNESDEPGIVEAAMYGRVVHVTVEDEATGPGTIRTALASAGVDLTELEPVEPSLEDVFTSLVRAEGGAVIG